MPLHISSTCAHYQVKTALHSHWYHDSYRWPSRAHNETGLVGMHALKPVNILKSYTF